MEHRAARHIEGRQHLNVVELGIFKNAVENPEEGGLPRPLVSSDNVGSVFDHILERCCFDEVAFESCVVLSDGVPQIKELEEIAHLHIAALSRFVGRNVPQFRVRALGFTGGKSSAAPETAAWPAPHPRSRE